MHTSTKKPPRRRLTNLHSLKLALAETTRRLESGDLKAEQGRVLVDAYRTMADLIRSPASQGSRP